MKNNKQKLLYYVILVSIILFSGSFIAVMGYLNFKSNYKDIQNQIYQEIASESIEGIESSMNFGKSLENYYGMNRYFDGLKTRIGDQIEVFVISDENKLLYYSLEEGGSILHEVNASFSSGNFKRAVGALHSGADSKVYSIGSRNYIIQPIMNGDNCRGFFVLTYEDGFISSQLGYVRKTIAWQTAIAIIICFILFTIGSLLFERLEIIPLKKQKLMQVFPIVFIMLTVIIQSIFSVIVYQNSYKSSMFTGAENILNNMEDTISQVADSGVALDEVSGVLEYLTEKVENIPILWNIRISKEIANAANVTGRENKLLLSYKLGKETLKLEAELSSDYINDKTIQIILLMVSTLIIMIIFIIEIMKLPGLILYRVSSRSNTECEESYVQVSNSLRITAFLCSTAEYICVPYAAMIIRDMNESVFGLSVGMTAALPLSLEGLAQMAAMLVLPKYVKKINIKTTLFLSVVMMAACNIMAFSSNTALFIIIYRGLAGIAYAGFKQVSNYLITKGYHTDLQRSKNLSQDNAGLLGGITCGAGLGAIISSTFGYSMTFFISALVFFVYLVVTVYVIPWKWLKGRTEEVKEKERLNIRKILRMVFSWEMIRYVIFIGIPLNIGVLFCVTLIPGICQNNNISTIMLSYCYIANGIAGIYIGPALVNWSKKMFGLKKSIGFAFAVTGISIVILKLPLLVVMMVISSMVFGFLDGFATPLAMDRFMELSVVKKTVNESAALIFCVVLSYVLITIAPMIAELMLIETKSIFDPLVAASIIYGAVALLLMLFGRKRKEMKRGVI